MHQVSESCDRYETSNSCQENLGIVVALTFFFHYIILISEQCKFCLSYLSPTRTQRDHTYKALNKPRHGEIVRLILGLVLSEIRQF